MRTRSAMLLVLAAVVYTASGCTESEVSGVPIDRHGSAQPQPAVVSAVESIKDGRIIQVFTKTALLQPGLTAVAQNELTVPLVVARGSVAEKPAESVRWGLRTKDGAYRTMQVREKAGAPLSKIGVTKNGKREYLFRYHWEEVGDSFYLKKEERWMYFNGRVVLHAKVMVTTATQNVGWQAVTDNSVLSALEMDEETCDWSLEDCADPEWECVCDDEPTWDDGCGPYENVVESNEVDLDEDDCVKCFWEKVAVGGAWAWYVSGAAGVYSQCYTPQVIYVVPCLGAQANWTAAAAAVNYAQETLRRCMNDDEPALQALSTLTRPAKLKREARAPWQYRRIDEDPCVPALSGFSIG